MDEKCEHPIGFIDSGIGGMGIALEVLRRLPEERLLYFADNAWCPYGGREPVDIANRLAAVTGCLIDYGCKIIVMACNTGTVSSIKNLRDKFKIPIVGVVPVIKTAAQRTVNHRIGVLATEVTLKSESYRKLIDDFAIDCEVFGNYQQGLVEAIEFGDWNNPELQLLLHKGIDPLLASEIDVLALGCTHFTLLKGRIQDMAGPGIMVLDSNDAVANQVRRVLEANESLCKVQNSEKSERLKFLVSGPEQSVKRTAEMLFGLDVNVIKADNV